MKRKSLFVLSAQPLQIARKRFETKTAAIIDAKVFAAKTEIRVVHAAGVMGTAIAAHLANAGVPVTLLDI